MNVPLLAFLLNLFDKILRPIFNSFTFGDVKLEYVDSANDHWGVRIHRNREFRKQVKRQKRNYRRIARQEPVQYEDELHSRIGDFLDRQEHLDLQGRVKALYPTEHFGTTENSSFVSQWFDLSHHALYWQSRELLEEALDEVRKTGGYEVYPKKPLSSAEEPIYPPIEIEFRLRNRRNESIHLTKITAETVAISQLGAGAGCELMPAHSNELRISLSNTRIPFELKLSSVAEPSDITKLLVKFFTPDGYGDGAATFLVRLVLCYNDGKHSVLGYYWF